MCKLHRVWLGPTCTYRYAKWQQAQVLDTYKVGRLHTKTAKGALALLACPDNQCSYLHALSCTSSSSSCHRNLTSFSERN